MGFQDLLSFPTPLPDEMLFSIYCRYHALSGNSYPTETRRQLTGCDAEGFRRRPATTLFELYQRLPKEIFPSFENLLLQHTLYPYYLTTTRFPVFPNKLSVNSEEWTCVFPEIRDQRTGKWSSRRKFCARCVVDDLDAYGVAYWHRSHQPDECVICCKHRCRLIWTCPYCGSPYRVDHELYLPSLTCPAGHIIDPNSPIFTNGILEPELTTAQWGEKLLSAYQSCGDHGVLLSFYRDRMRQRGWDWDMVDGRMTHRNRHYVMLQIRKFWGLDRWRRLPVMQCQLYPAENAPYLHDSITADDIFLDPYWLYRYYRDFPPLTSLWITGYLLGSIELLDRVAELAKAAKKINTRIFGNEKVECSLTTRGGQRGRAYLLRNPRIEAKE